TEPLDPDDPVNADRRGSDDPDTYTPNPGLRASMDTLGGRSTNRYFYRAIYMDGANNRSDLSLSEPPVYLPRVVPPDPPLVQLALAGEGKINVRWMISPSPDLARYRIYRAG